jgi:hypothetical protein
VVGLFVQVTNLTNYRGFPNPQNMIRYRESLRFPWYQGERQGNDRWGEWNKDHIDLGYHTWNQFINPTPGEPGCEADPVTMSPAS